MNFRFYEFDNNKVKAVTTYKNKIISAVAVCSPEDVYDFEIGKAIAKAKCELKVAKKRIKNLKTYSSMIYADFDEMIELYEREFRRQAKRIKFAEKELEKKEKALEEIINEVNINE